MDDYRLRILWIEDKADTYAVNLRDLGARGGATFSVQVLSQLKDILDLRTRNSGSDKTPDFDVVISDFNLVDGNILPEATETAGLKSRAAGFMIGTLLALREPHRPRAIVPYSQNSEEFGETFRLFRSYLPRSIVVADEFETDKAQLDKTQVIIRATQAYCESLVRLSEAGRAHFSDETVRWLLAAREQPVEISPDKVLEITFIGGHRRVLLKALFYQEFCDSFVDGNLSSMSSALNKFVDRLCFKNRDFVDARELADRYWERSSSAASAEAYMATQPAANDLAGGARARWLMTEPHSSRVKSYAAIDLLLRSYVQSVLVKSVINTMAQSRDDEEDPASVSIEEVAGLAQAWVDASAGSLFSRCLRELVEFHERQSVYTLEELLDRLDRVDRKGTDPEVAPGWEQRWVRALDPEPKPGEALHHTGPRGIGKTLGSHLTKQMNQDLNESIGPQLIAGAGDLRLAPELAAVARLFALEYIPDGLPWPAFLLNSGES